MKRVQAKDKAHLQELIREAFDKGIYDLNFIDTSKVTEMKLLFSKTDHQYLAGVGNFDVSGWDVSQVTNMRGLFYCCNAFDQDLSSWDVSQVTTFVGMFADCSAFNQDISAWDVGQVSEMSGMFYNCHRFDQDLSTWDVSQVTNMNYMFSGCKAFNQDLSAWDVSKVESMYLMFNGASNFNPAHMPHVFFTQKNIDPYIVLDQAIKDLIDTYDPINLELALNLANNVDKILEAKHYIERNILIDELFGKIGDIEAYRARFDDIIQSL